MNMGYRVVKKAWQYVQPFWYNTSVWQRDRRTDGRKHVIAIYIAITCFSIADARKNNIINIIFDNIDWSYIGIGNWDPAPIINPGYTNDYNCNFYQLFF